MKEKIMVGYDLGNHYSQISYCTYDGKEPETLSVVAGEESYNIPTVLCKRKGVNQWFFGKEAYKHAEEEGSLVTDLVELARAGEKVVVEGEEFEPAALLTLFIRRSLNRLSLIAETDRIGAVMFTCEHMDSRMAELMDGIAAGLSLKTKNICYQSHVESIYYYTIHQPAELWQKQVTVFDYITDAVKVYSLEFNRRTKPVVAFAKEAEYPFLSCGEDRGEEPAAESLGKQLDERFLALLKEVCEGKMISSAYLLGTGFKEEWMKESLPYLCRGKRVFQGNNLYSKGACYAMRERISPSETGRAHVFLGDDKLKANIGMRVSRRGEDSYYALLDAGTSWFEAHNSIEFLLQTDNTFSLVITPLNGRDIKFAQVTLEGLPLREGAASRLYMEIGMTAEGRIALTVEDLGFGEIYPSGNQKWTESFAL